jgi:hypothetical protein
MAGLREMFFQLDSTEPCFKRREVPDVAKEDDSSQLDQLKSVNIFANFFYVIGLHFDIRLTPHVHLDVPSELVQ